ncbi:MAG TPA: NTP transferase domain-containing protein [Patescibacteria group bacterium]|nr:NTP transferase domain-containing protein [Patescibacteria group bacterium]
MHIQIKKNVAAVILAAGKGKRMQLEDRNKVTAHLANKPLIQHTVDFMHSLGIETILVVVGHRKESVMESLDGQNIIFVEQQEQLGTGHALQCAVNEMPEGISDILVAYGDDAVLYAEKNISVIENLFFLHEQKSNAVTFLTLEQKNPYGLGRIIRDKQEHIQAIIEEKDATDEQKMIKEINPGCFVFSVSFLRKFLPQLRKSSVTGEYYVTSLIDLAIEHHERVDTIQGGSLFWRGVNTKEELQAAEKLYNNK